MGGSVPKWIADTDFSGPQKFHERAVPRIGGLGIAAGLWLAAGAMWLQLGNKSMLMSQKLGQRLADDCMSPEQITLAEDLKKNPRPGLLDSPAASGTAPATPK
jgi:hypothetical protein